MSEQKFVYVEGEDGSLMEFPLEDKPEQGLKYTVEQIPIWNRHDFFKSFIFTALLFLIVAMIIAVVLTLVNAGLKVPLGIAVLFLLVWAGAYFWRRDL